jgi:4-phospho-D-threonate 3-dehydrogenase / 4-phospho-D-erythronate 3-dehydrogenase
MIGVTLGDPAGVGPEIIAKSLSKFHNQRLLVLIGSERNFAKVLSGFGDGNNVLSECKFVDVGGDEVVPGKIQKAAGEIALKSIEKSVELAMEGEIDAIATAPINKEAIRLAGSKYIDHTTMLAALTGTRDVATVFESGENLRIYFMTKHMPLIEIFKEITERSIYESIRSAERCLRLLGISRRRIAVAALNPHAGEGGLLGGEEASYIEPAVVRARRDDSIDVYGPFPADSIFFRASKGEFDIVVSLYHDQGHIAAKMLDFYSTVSLNIGLPFLRTSVDHGTAFDIAGKGIANEASMVHAISKAIQYGHDYRERFRFQ